MRARGPTGAAAFSGVVPRPRAKVPHVVVRSRSRMYASSPRDAPSQRPGDNSTRIARTTAKWHSKAARKTRPSRPYASAWLLSPRDEREPSEPRGCKVPVRTYGGARRAAHALGWLRLM